MGLQTTLCVCGGDCVDMAGLSAMTVFGRGAGEWWWNNSQITSRVIVTNNASRYHPIQTIGAPNSIIPVFLCRMPFLPSWRGTVVERQSLTGELSLSCARPAADG